ncbi:MAG: polyprenol monophosphomannose synthase [Akkermansiaceae bacterium]|jgi:dolichol-phosphate mannosyltransferase|nr:polyprenol monophosphomannose synthase [Akkermansiaceae bacterium]
MHSGKGVVIVVPTYQEAANLPILLDQLLPALPEARLWIVDDASGDGTPEQLKQHPLFGERLFLLERSGKSGLASALCDGFRIALAEGAEIIVQMDADLSHDPADVVRLIEAAADGADLAIGSRYCVGGGIRHWSPWRRLLSRAAAAYVRGWTGMNLSDPTAGFRAFRAPALARALESPTACDGYGFQVEMAHTVWKQGGVIREVPVVFTERREGQSKLSSAIVYEAILRVPLLCWHRHPPRER